MVIYSVSLIIINLISISLYLPINRLISGGYRPELSIDNKIPFVPQFVFPYIFFYYPWILGLYFWYGFQPVQALEQLTIATVLACGLGFTLFLLFPTYVSCRYPSGKGLSIKLLQYIHRIDNENNACPSMHVYMAVLLGYFSWSTSAYINMLVLLAAICVAISTVLIKRHYVLDVVGGVLVGSSAIATTLLL